MRATADSPRSVRLVIHEFENLIECGQPALPVIQQFLAQNIDVDYEVVSRRHFEGGKMPTEFQLPPSLRFGLAFPPVPSKRQTGWEYPCAAVSASLKLRYRKPIAPRQTSSVTIKTRSNFDMLPTSLPRVRYAVVNEK